MAWTVSEQALARGFPQQELNLAGRRRFRNTWILVLGGIAVPALVIALVSLQPDASPLRLAIRGAALTGYLFAFLSAISTAYVRQMTRFFGRSFTQVHHVLSVTGLTVIALHPLGFAWESRDLRVLLPILSSWMNFLKWGGRTALYLIGLAVLAAALRKTIGRRWRVIHLLNYLALLLATVHGILIGTDFQHTIVRVLVIGMSLTVVGVFAKKRLRARRRRSSKGSRR